MSSSTFANYEYYAYISYSSVEAASNNNQRRTISRPTLKTRVMGMDLRYGLTTRVKDPNNSELLTINDGLGRLTSVRSPNEVNDSSTIDMSYAPIAVLKADGTGIQTPAHAVATYHLRQPFERGSLVSTYSDVMRVVTFVDGFGNLLQTHRMASATQSYGNPRAGFYATDTLSMAYDDMWRITSKSQRLSQVGVMSAGTLNAGYSMNYHHNPSWGKHYQMKNVAETHYRTAGTPMDADNILSTHSYSYDPNGNLTYESVARKRHDGNTTTQKISERKLLWDGMNRLRGISDNGYVSLYWYDADGNRTVKEHLGGEAVWVNGTPAGQTTDTLIYSVYPNAYVSINGDRWTKHYYIGGERIASRTGTVSGGFNGLNTSDNQAAGQDLGITINYGNMCHAQEDSIASMYAQFGVPYEAQRTTARGDRGHLYVPIIRQEEREEKQATAMASEAGNLRNHPNTLGEGQVYFYLRDHLGSTLSVTDSLGNYVQQVEYTPWGEVFVERALGNSGYTTPYLFNGKELDEETGLYYYGARYYNPKTSVWYSTDYEQEKYPFASSYCYTLSSPINAIDPNGKLVIFINGMNVSSGGKAEYWEGLNDIIMSIVNDNHQRYYDGSIRGVLNTLSNGILTGNLNPRERFKKGFEMALKDAEHIFNSLKDGETIKVFTHSMGAAYGKGFIIGLQSYAKLNNLDIDGIIEFEVDLAPYQSVLQLGGLGVKTVSIGHFWDGVAGLSLMPFAENHNTRFDKFSLNPFKEHSVNSFTKKELENFIPKVKGIKITNRKIWEQYGKKEEK